MTLKINLPIFGFMILSALGVTGRSVAAPSYVGYEGCKMCHHDEFADWEQSKHAKAFELLKPGMRNSAKRRAELDPNKDYTTSVKCPKCHTTGYREVGGYSNLNETPSRVGVGCEMCHGPGSEYRAIHKEKHTGFTSAEVMAAGQTYASRDVSVCKRCHENEDAPMQPKLDDKYIFKLEDRLKITRSFHKYYK